MPTRNDVNPAARPGLADVNLENLALALSLSVLKILRDLQAGTAAAPLSTPRQLVDLDQIAALVRRSKRTLEKYTRRMPAPVVEGGGGRAHLWDYPTVRPWLIATFRVPLPEQLPDRLAEIAESGRGPR
jgi:hypothetical protein